MAMGGAGEALAATLQDQWNGAVFWNGAHFKNVGGTCGGGGKNTEFQIIDSHVTQPSGGSYLAAGGDYAITFKSGTDYFHGSGLFKDYEHRQYYTGVAAKKKYLKFYDGYVRFDCDAGRDALSGASDDGGCTFNADLESRYTDGQDVTVNLIDDIGMTASQAAGKRAFIVLQGSRLQYGKLHKHEDHYVTAALASDTPDANNDVSLDFRVKLHDGTDGGAVYIAEGDSYTVWIYYTIGVYDPAAVRVATFNDDSGFGAYAPGTTEYSGSFSSSAAFSGQASVTCADGCKDATQTFALGLTAWGFNHSKNYETNQLSNRAHVESVTATRAAVNAKGSLYRAPCVGVPKAVLQPNKNEFLVISCRDKSVCGAEYSYTAWETKNDEDHDTGWYVLWTAEVERSITVNGLRN